MPHHVGTVVAERYELTAVLGKGGHGVVYRATDRTTGKGVAVKMLSDSYANAPEYAARLAREQEALVALAGTSAVAVYDMCQAPNGAVCLVMELLEGTDLEMVLSDLEAKNERMPLARVSQVMEPIVDTLERAHEAKILHRDLKPANIFLLSDGEGVRLFDFGLSRKMTSARLTVIGTVMGSPSYIAPEVWKGRSDELDTRVDVYSLGVILFRILSGKLPFEGANLIESLTLATTAPRPSLRALRPDLSPAVDDWVQKALAIDRERRFETATSLWGAFLDALRYEPPTRARRPVADSLVNAWKAAASAFRKFIPAKFASDRPPPSMPPPSIPPDTSAIDSSWEELTDADVLGVKPPPLPVPDLSRIDEGWEEVSADELDRPSVLASLAPEAKPDAKAPEAAPELEPPARSPAKKRRRSTPKKSGGRARSRASAPDAGAQTKPAEPGDPESGAAEPVSAKSAAAPALPSVPVAPAEGAKKSGGNTRRKKAASAPGKSRKKSTPKKGGKRKR
ncbi:MAG TPA: protein kinase [Polyangiaceae bacterium]|nr:protein kinase [Polyangiaceae bacterium]